MSFLFVKVHYGPDNTYHRLEHKPQRFHGLRDRLQKLGFRVDLYQVPHVNYCMIEMCGHEVFRCNVTNLKFSTLHEHDVVAKRAIDAVTKASAKFRLARTYLWLWTLLDYNLFRRGPYSPKNYWPIEDEFPPLATCQECVECCKIITRKKNPEDD